MCQIVLKAHFRPFGQKAFTIFSQEFVYGDIGTNLWNYNNASNTVEPTPIPNFGEMLRGFIRYEITDHLGNVRSTITDRKLPSQNGANTEYSPDIESAQDYYPFGMLMPDRQYAAAAMNQELQYSVSITETTIIEHNFSSTKHAWVAPNGATTTAGSSQMTVSTTEKQDAVYFDYPTTIGLQYKFYVDVDAGTCADLVLKIQNVPVSLIEEQSGTGSHTFSFTASTSSTRLRIYRDDATSLGSLSFYVDNVKLVRLDETITTNTVVVGNGMGYRYGFNGMERDDEVNGVGNSYTTVFRQYDARLGRWLSLDPAISKYPEQSPYIGFNNNPIFFIDRFGDEGEPSIEVKKYNRKGKEIKINWFGLRAKRIEKNIIIPNVQVINKSKRSMDENDKATTAEHAGSAIEKLWSTKNFDELSSVGVNLKILRLFKIIEWEWATVANDDGSISRVKTRYRRYLNGNGNGAGWAIRKVTVLMTVKVDVAVENTTWVESKNDLDINNGVLMIIAPDPVPFGGASEGRFLWTTNVFMVSYSLRQNSATIAHEFGHSSGCGHRGPGLMSRKHGGSQATLWSYLILGIPSGTDINVFKTSNKFELKYLNP